MPETNIWHINCAGKKHLKLKPQWVNVFSAGSSDQTSDLSAANQRQLRSRGGRGSKTSASAVILVYIH